MLNKLKKKNNKGFTLVELLVVIAIMGVLAVVAVPSLFKNLDKAKVAKLESDYNVVKNAVISAYNDGDTTIQGTTGVVITSPTSTSSNIGAPLNDYIEELSMPFGGTYTIKGNGTTTPKQVELVITPGEGKKITASAVKKLKTDLGEGNVVSNPVTVPETGATTVTIKLIGLQ